MLLWKQRIKSYVFFIFMFIAVKSNSIIKIQLFANQMLYFLLESFKSSAVHFIIINLIPLKVRQLRSKRNPFSSALLLNSTKQQIKAL